MQMSEFVEKHVIKKVSKLIDHHIETDSERMIEFFPILLCHFDTEGEPVEIMQYYLVSEWLAYKLKEREKAVTMDFYGLPIWGRTTCGQSIKMDSVICEIYQERYPNF